MNDHTLEQTVSDALHDAADHAALSTPVTLADAPARLAVTRRRRTRVLVAACAAVVAVGFVVAGAILARDDDGVQVSSPIPAAREVPVADIDHPDLEVFMPVKAADDQIAVVRAALEASPDVAHYAYLDRDAAYREFAEIFSCNPDLVGSINPQDLPVSFRVVATDPGAVERLRTTLGTVPGVEAIEAPGDQTSTANTTCSDTRQSETEETEPPATTPPTLPPAGEQPTDATEARDAIRAVFTEAWAGTSTVEQRARAMQAFDELSALIDQARAQSNEMNRAIGRPEFVASMHAVVDEIRFVTPERAAVEWRLAFDGTDGVTLLGYAVVDGGTWKVSRDTVCAVLEQYAAISCPS